VSYLPDHYRAVNFHSGHHRSCGYGAGADCDCHVSEFRYFLLEVQIGGEFRAVEIETEAKLCNRHADRWQRGGWKIRYTTGVTHASDEGFYELQESCEIWRERIADWASD
jgi:hypothetical protein